jgi:NAD(P)-dependent dehydrogenase (short-subunit alcohol dehydrogenase family)
MQKGQVEAKGWACDVSNEENVQAVFADIEKTYGRIDVSGL